MWKDPKKVRKVSREDARAVAAAGGYSSDRYASWAACAAMLLGRGYDARQAEAILRSKWTRWAADHSRHPYGQCTAQDLAVFLDDLRNQCTPAAVAELVAGTFPEVAK